ncbi:MAG: threonine aldolase family protein, partial [Phycisphaerae bacterium]
GGREAYREMVEVLSQPGDEIILHEDGHIYHYEAGAPAALAGCSMRLLPGQRGLFDAEAVRSAIRPANSHYPRSALVVVENTHNRGGGSCWPIDSIKAIRDVADRFGLRMHLDGARLMNACVATGNSPTDYTRYFDTVSICFSKGLGAPVGSAVAGSAETIQRVHRFRKMFGGGMRQAGIIAAGALYALENNIERLADDHANAKRLARAVADMPQISIDLNSVETNIVYFDVDRAFGSAQRLCDMLREHDVWMLPVAAQRVRGVTHLDVSAHDIERAITALARILGK